MLQTACLFLQRLKWLIALVIAYTPGSFTRKALYRLVMGYHISPRSRIGFGTVIRVRSATIGKARIGRFNTFSGPQDLVIGDGAKIGFRNEFECGAWAGAEYGCYCRIGPSTLITSDHFVDVTGGFELGDGSWIAGRGSQIWTHGAGAKDREVRIGSRCYIGSAVCMAPGAGIGDDCLVAIGSVVVGKIPGDHLLIGGSPAKIIRTEYTWNQVAQRKGDPWLWAMAAD